MADSNRSLPARVLLWAMLVGRVLRENSFYGMEQIVRAAGCRVLGLEQSFSNDALSYFVERLDPATSRSALIEVVRQAKRGKAFQDCRFIGLALDGTGAGRSQQSHCAWCRPIRDAKHNVIGYHHKLVTISVVGTGLTLPFDVEPYGPGDSELAAGQRLLTAGHGQHRHPFCRLSRSGWGVRGRALPAHRQPLGAAGGRTSKK